MSSESDEKMVTLEVWDDGNMISSKKVPYENIKFCKTINNMLNDLCQGDEGINFDMPIPLPKSNVKEDRFLDYVSEYGGFMRTPDFPKDERKEDAKIENELTQWEKDFIERIGTEDMTEMILLANFLNNPQLLEMLCCATAQEMKGKTAEEIRQRFNIKNDFSPEEEAKLKKENKFIEEAQERT